MTIFLYNVKKRRNSTKIPTGEYVEVDGVLKQDFALTGLEVRFRFSDPATVPTYNYAQIPAFSRFYFITDWFYQSGFWSAILAVDVLATYRSEIGNSRQYMTRCSNPLFTYPIDTTYPTSGNVSRAGVYISASQFWGADINKRDGTVVIGCVGSNGGSIGAVTYYALSMTAFSAFMTAMLSSPAWMGISANELSEALQKAVINPTQYIVYCRWFPIRFFEFFMGKANVTNTLQLGWWTFNLTETGLLLSTPAQGSYIKSALFDVRKHPASNKRKYANLSPYTTITLKVPPFGVFDIDTTELFGYDKVGIQITTSLLTGDATLKVAPVVGSNYDFENFSFLIVEGQIGVQLPVAQIAGNINNFKTGLTAGAVSGVAALIGG